MFKQYTSIYGDESILLIEQELGEMTLSDHDSNENADYELSEPEDSDDELEFNSDASVSEDSEVEEELVEEDAKNQ